MSNAIDRLEEMEGRATGGPWTTGDVMPGEPDTICGTRTVDAPYDGEMQTVAFVHPSTTGEGSTWTDARERDANAALISALRNASKPLLAVVRAGEEVANIERPDEMTEPSDCHDVPGWAMHYIVEMEREISELRLALATLKEMPL